MIRSIRFSLTLWYGGILTILLCFFGWLVYTNVKSNLYRDIDKLLLSQADGVEDAVYSFWKAEVETRSGNLPQGLEKKEILKKFYAEIETGNLAPLIDRWAEETENLVTTRPIRLMTLNGEILASSGSMERLVLPVTRNALSRVRNNRMVFETFQLLDYRVRLVTYPVFLENHLLYLIQVGTPLYQADASLERLSNWLVWLIPSTALLASLIGWFLASLVLKPIGRMMTQADTVGASRLHERIDVPKTGDELERLAQTFNAMLARLEQSFKRLRQFSAAASHELRTPLTVMKGEIEWALRKPRGEENYERVLRTQLEVINDMAHVVEQLLAVAHADEGESDVEWKPAELSALIRSVTESYHEMAQNKDISIHISAQDLVWVRGERVLLERLIANLLENALKHTPARGQIKIELLSRQNKAVMTVADTGSGISPEEIPRVFDKFFNHKKTKEGISSTGIGLGLCRWIVEAHQGEIAVVSPPGQGAQFTVSLPLIRP